MMEIDTLFPVKEFLENLLLDESRDAYSSMSKAQRMLVRRAFSCGLQKGKQLGGGDSAKSGEKSFSEMEVELRQVFDSYPEYHDPELGGGSFDSMVVKFANDDFYKLHLVAKRYLELSQQPNSCLLDEDG